MNLEDMLDSIEAAGYYTTLHSNEDHSYTMDLTSVGGNTALEDKDIEHSTTIHIEHTDSRCGCVRKAYDIVFPTL